MGRRVPGVLALLVVFAACAGSGQIRLSGPTISPAADVIEVAVESVRDLGYEVRTIDRKSGLIVAEKQEGKVHLADAVQVLPVTVESSEYSVTGRTEFWPLMGGG